jgi:hypothetical protein
MGIKFSSIKDNVLIDELDNNVFVILQEATAPSTFSPISLLGMSRSGR